jgi:TM2 domain-containing membrane protein YozV
MDDAKRQQFVLLYQGRRKDPQTVLLCTLLGFVVVAGVQRFILGQMGMGILYLFTAGLCFVGTIVDLINYKSMTLEYNRRQVVECRMMAGALN